MNKPIAMMLHAGMSKQPEQGRSTRNRLLLVSKFQTAARGSKVLEFPRPQTAEVPGSGRKRQSWGKRAGVSDGERLIAVAGGALIVAGSWAGHSLLMWMHVL